MDELKEKVKKLRLNPFKKISSGAFKGRGHVLGSAEPPPSSSGSAGGRVVQPAAPARPAAPAPPAQQLQPAAQQLSRPLSSAGSEAPVPLRPPQPQAAQPPLPAAPSTGAAAAATTAAAVPEAAAGPPSPDSQEALEAAVAQLASDGPHAVAAADLLTRLLGNVLGSLAEPKYRRLRLSNPRIQEVVGASGGAELLLACGFEFVFEEPTGGGAEGHSTEGFAILDADADLRPLRSALELLQPLRGGAPAGGQPAGQQQQLGGSSTSGAAAVGAAAQLLPSASSSTSSLSNLSQQSSPVMVGRQPTAAAAQRPQPERSWDAPRPRATRVLLPQSPATDLPEWFFGRTGAELKAAFLAAVCKREQDQVLMTRAMRERQRGPAPAAPVYALIKVRLPEGLALQGEFNPGEPVAAIFGWVSDCLRDPGCTYELVLPSRRPLEAAGQAVREVPELLPAATLNFRWTGQSAVAMQTTPALRDDLIRAAQAAERTQQAQ